MSNDRITVNLVHAEKELQRRIEEITRQAQICVKRDDYDTADSHFRQAKEMCDFARRLEELHLEWEDILERFPDEEHSSEASTGHDRWQKEHSSAGPMSVRFPDGTIISEARACDTFAQAIERIGVEKVAELGLKLNGEPLLSRKPPRRPHNRQSAKRVGDFYLITHSNTMKKVTILNQVGERLGLALRASARCEVCPPATVSSDQLRQQDRESPAPSRIPGSHLSGARRSW